MSPAPSREPSSGTNAARMRQTRQQRLRLNRPSPRSRWRRLIAPVKQALRNVFAWGGWSKVAAVATALTAVAALWFSAQSLASTRNQYALSERGQLTDRFGRAIDQLGSDKLDIRLGGIYSLERLAKDSPSDYDVIFEVLAAYIRTHAGPATACASSTPPVDVHAALSVIGRRKHQPSFDVIDLTDICLRGAKLASVRNTAWPAPVVLAD